jgi:hypothetical protein
MVIVIVVPIVVTVPIALGAPFPPLRVIPGVVLFVAAIPFPIQFYLCVFSLATAFAVLVDFMPIMIARFLNALLALTSAVGGRTRRRR